MAPVRARLASVLRGAAFAALLLVAPAGATAAILYSGSYATGPEKGIHAWRFDERTGTVAPLGLAASTPQPAHLTIAPSGGFLYAVNWEKDGGISAFAVHRADGALTFLGRVPAHAVQPNQIMLDPGGRIAVSVSYASGSVVAYRVLPDGRLSDAFYVDRHVAAPGSTSPPRTHGIQFSADGRLMYAADLGLDRIYVYRVDGGHARIRPAAMPFFPLPPGSGPRHLTLSEDGRFLYVNHEIGNAVSVLAVDGARLRAVQTVATLPAGYAGRNTTADIVLTADGRFLYVSNRGHDSIATFAVDRRDGRLAPLGTVASEGRTPRNLALSPDRGYLLAANENGGNIVVFGIDAATGALSRVAAVPAERPGALAFLRER